MTRRKRPAAARCICAAAVAGLAAVSLPDAAIAREGSFSLRLGVERTRGDYSGTETVHDTYLPLTLLYQARRVGVRVTVPYLEMEFVEPAAAGGRAATYTESGLGDIIAGVTFYDVLRSADGSAALDFTGRVKLPTADEDRGLGTGEPDYSLQADAYRFFARTTLVATVGYRIRGEPADFGVNDTWQAALGGLYRFSPLMSGGVFFDYRESSIPGAASIREGSVSFSRRIHDERWRLQGYLVRGFSDTAIDWGLGLSVRREFF